MFVHFSIKPFHFCTVFSRPIIWYSFPYSTAVSSVFWFAYLAHHLYLFSGTGPILAVHTGGKFVVHAHFFLLSLQGLDSTRLDSTMRNFCRTLILVFVLIFLWSFFFSLSLFANLVSTDFMKQNPVEGLKKKEQSYIWARACNWCSCFFLIFCVQTQISLPQSKRQKVKWIMGPVWFVLTEMQNLW